MEDTTTFDNLRQRAQALEKEVEGKLSAFSRVSQSVTSLLSSPDPEALTSNDRVVETAEGELAELLAQLQQLDEQMSPTSSTPAHTRQLQRHRELCLSFTREFRKIKTNITTARENAEIFNTVRGDMRDGERTNRNDILLRERSSIQNSQRSTAATLEQAVGARESLGHQRQTFTSITSRMSHLAQTLPGVNNLIGAISKKKNKDSIILAVVIASCTLFCLLYWLNK
uniref:Golgi SNAP receptor complex member 1 n=1 Tax=Palpitomonas bilix TaxID=652834 RepID=A0A7S3D056_9EUKA|mmetsp:Transcript_16750/g.42046  ORF Transcript_16750/g.42046 Transcript_16750/m.42046 type:complete len:227 (+) Transcript_16750:211-891(+)